MSVVQQGKQKPMQVSGMDGMPEEEVVINLQTVNGHSKEVA